MAENLQESLFDFLDASVTPYHGAAKAAGILEKAGYSQLDETSSWNLKSGQGYYIIRNGSSLIAFHTGSFKPGSYGFRIITAHTDSPGFRVKGDTLKESAGVWKAGLEVLGGPILSTWLDRKLTLAGRLLVRSSQGIESRLYRKAGAPFMIPNPPIHLNRDVNKKVEYNPHKHLSLVIGEAGDESVTHLYQLMAEEIGISPDSIIDADLLVCDAEGAVQTGWEGHYFTSGRIDNLGMCHAALSAMVETKGQKSVTVAALFDNEEMGSLTPHGADSTYLEQILERIVMSAGGNREDYMRSAAGSFMVSADQAHAIHPNYLEIYDETYSPYLNKGPVVKFNANWNYATTGATAARFKEFCREADVPCQTYLNRSDIRGGRSLGPIAAARLGIPAVDVGNPIWSMHSIRETAAMEDQLSMIKALKVHLNSIG